MAESKKISILYVDDEEFNLTSFKAAFRRHYNVFTATSGREGIEILRKEPIQIIITDQRMPEMTGVQFLEAIIPEFPDAVRMILTGYSDVEAVIKAINSGQVYRYVTKPWNESELKLSIDSGANIYRLEQSNRELISQLNEEVARQKQIMDLFQKYVPENVLLEILNTKDIDAPIIQGESRIIGVCFIDIRNFTSLAARLDPKVVVSLLNDFFTLVTECVKTHKGTVNKFLGDGVLCIFGAPRSYIDNPQNAIFCCLNVMDSIHDLAAKWRDKINEDITIGIGVHKGEVIVGNMGSNDRIEYSVIGDPVNVAARIQELSKDHPNSMLISENMYSDVKDLVNVEELEPQTIKGKDNKIKLYRVLGRKIK